MTREGAQEPTLQRGGGGAQPGDLPSLRTRCSAWVTLRPFSATAKTSTLALAAAVSRGLRMREPPMTRVAHTEANAVCRTVPRPAIRVGRKTRNGARPVSLLRMTPVTARTAVIPTSHRITV